MTLFYKLHVRQCLNETTRVLTFSPQPQRSKTFHCIISQDVPVELRVFLSFLMFWQELEILRRVKRTSSVRRWDFRWGIISASLPDVYHYDYTIHPVTQITFKHSISSLQKVSNSLHTVCVNVQARMGQVVTWALT